LEGTYRDLHVQRPTNAGQLKKQTLCLRAV